MMGVFTDMRKAISTVRAYLLAIFVALLTACSSGPNDDLNVYVQEVKGQKGGNIEPLPPLRTYDAYVYNVMALRSPFDQPIELPEETVAGPSDPKIEPDWSRPREYLESFNLDALQMVGSLLRQGRFWVLIKDPEGGVNRVNVGNFLGKDHGKIVSASETQIDLVEIVSDGLGGWLKRPRTLTIAEKE